VPPTESRRGRFLEWLERRLNVTEIFSLLSIYGLLYAELDVRKPLREALREAVARPVSIFSRWPRALGLVTVVLLLFEAVTGVLLALYYQPTPEAAYASVRVIVRDVSFGWLVHQIHRWGAQLLLGVLLLRLVRFLAQALYRAPREILWMAAVGLFVVAACLDLSGRLLTWDARSYWSAVRGLEVLEALPMAGGAIAFLLGGREPGALILLRAYFFHIALLPALFALLLYLSFATVRRVGLSGEEESAGPLAQRPYRTHLANIGILVVLMLAILVTLAVLVPASFPAEADPLLTPAGIRPPWPLWGAYGLLEIAPSYLPRPAAGGLLMALVALLACLPLLEGAAARDSGRRRRIVRLAGILLLALWALMSLYGFALERIGGGA
jgi:quinol-cytochrome oxidoreductase complex cytochrome b subunit